MRRFLVLALASASACARPLGERPAAEPVIPSAPSSPRAATFESPWATAETPIVELPRPAQTIYRSEIERALRGGPGYLLYQLGPEPFRSAGQFIGWKITRLFPSDPTLCGPECDLRIGDIVLAVDGNPMRTPDAFAELVARMPERETIEVIRLREDRRVAVTYRIDPDR